MEVYFMMKKRVAIVGYGGMGSWHVSKIKNSDVVECAGIWDIKESRRDVAKNNGLYVYKSFEDLLADKSVDVVTIATPNDVHASLAIQAMRAGKHVICEKPVCMNSIELQNIINVSNATGMLFTTHQNRRWDSDYLIIKDLYKSGQLGKVFTIESRYQGSRGIPGDWRGEYKHGGGMMLDWGVHLIDQILNMVYDQCVTSIYCRCDHITNNEVDDGFKLDIHFDNGLVAHIEVGTNHFIALPRFYMAGMSGAAKIEDWNSACQLIICDQWKEENVVPIVTAAGLTKTMAPRDAKTTTKTIIPRPESDVHDFYRNFCNAIDGKETQIVTHQQLMRVMRIMEAAFLSDKMKQPIPFSDD
jgi:predicted dehydrogenase